MEDIKIYSEQQVQQDCYSRDSNVLPVLLWPAWDLAPAKHSCHFWNLWLMVSAQSLFIGMNCYQAVLLSQVPSLFI